MLVRLRHSYNVRLSAASSETVTVDYATQDSGATAPGDYIAVRTEKYTRIN